MSNWPSLTVGNAEIFVEKANPWGLEKIAYGKWREYFKWSGYIRECDECQGMWLGPAVNNKELKLHRVLRDGIEHHWCNEYCESRWVKKNTGHWNKVGFQFPKVRETAKDQYQVTQGGI